jgi:uncharacterized protein (TIGR02001 family)
MTCGFATSAMDLKGHAWCIMIGTASAFALLSIPAFSNDERAFEWTATGTGTSDYIFRGLSLSGEKPVFQSSIDGGYGILYFGVWGSGVADKGAPEVDFYVGINPVLGPATFDLGIVYYTCLWKDPCASNYIELKAGVEVSPITNLTLTPVFWYSPDADNYPETWATEGTASYQLPAVGTFTPTLSGLLGYSEQITSLASGADFTGLGVQRYLYWNAGVALAVEKFTFDFRYWDTDIDKHAGLADERIVFTASITLP